MYVAIHLSVVEVVKVMSREVTQSFGVASMVSVRTPEFGYKFASLLNVGK